MFNHKLLQSTAFRLTLKYALAYGLILGALFTGVLWISDQYIDDDTRHNLNALATQLKANGVNSQLAQDENLFWLVEDQHGQKKLGNLPSWPSEADIETDDELAGVWFDEKELPHGLFDDDVHLPVIAGNLSNGGRYIVTQRVEQVGWLYEITDYLTESLPAALLLSFIISLSVSRAIFRRVDVINTASIDIMRGDLSRRIDVGNGNADLDTMANNLNAMLDRIQQLVKGIREVTDGIAHDLRSPLTRLRSRLEVTLLETRKAEEYQQTIQQGIEDADGLIHTFNALLSIAQVEAGNHRSEWTQVNLAEIVEDVADLYSAVAEDNGQSFDLALDAQAQVLGSRNLLAQMVGNIIENAIKYAPTDGHINVAVKCREGQCVLEVSDNGPGIPIHERERALERFVRLDNSRHSPGNGLGLSMVKAVAHLHHAELVLSDANPGLKVQIIFA